MPRMKHLLRKLHMGGGGFHYHTRMSSTETPPPISPSPSPKAATSPSSALESVGSDDSAENSVDFSFFEEEFQMQIAMAMSVSDPDALEDPETAQIKAAKQISLGCSPSAIIAEFLSIRYWSNDILYYDERVLDGFYDVYGTTPNSFSQGKMPSLVDLQAIPLSDSIDYEVILVNRLVDPELQELEESVYMISMELQTLERDHIVNFLILKIANIVVDRMGGLVGDAEEMMKKWTVRSCELRNSLNTIILPLGSLNVGLSRHRALLFKVLADRINLPCMLVKGSYYIGTDEGAVNLIKLNNGREYIIDLMGAPGTLIPAEIPSSRLQNFQLEVMGPTEIAEGVKASCPILENGSGTIEISPDLDAVAKKSLFMGIRLKGDEQNLVEKNQMEKFENDFGKIFPSLSRSHEGSSNVSGKASASQIMKVKDVSKCVIDAAKNPEFAEKLHAVLLENSRYVPPELFLDKNPLDLNVCEVIEETNLVNGETVDDRAQYGTESFSNVPADSEEKCSLEDSVGQSVELACTDHNSGHSLPSATATEVFVLVNNGANRVVHTDYIGVGVITVDLTGMLARPLLEEQSDELSTSSQAKYYEVKPQNALIGDGGFHIVEKVGEGLNNTEKDKESAVRLIQTANNRLPNIYNSYNTRIHPNLGKVAEWEIPWEDIQMGERIGIGSSGEVHRADWNGTEVAVKKFMHRDISGHALAQFKCEVEIMLKLRHPNVVLFMGAVTHPSNLSIMTEFLSRGSLFRLLHRPNAQLGEKRRMQMALDVAKGMNYLHTSHPVIVHRDLKTPNLLVDKDWVVKVCDFGSSRMQHATFLSSNSIAGTPEWMAPEVLRNEPCNEKSDVYSFGVILWELATLCIPWTGLSSMQVVGAVGFQDRHLDIPAEVDPMVAEILTDCWHPNPQLRPSFRQLIFRLKHLKSLLVPRTRQAIEVTGTTLL